MCLYTYRCPSLPSLPPTPPHLFLPVTLADQENDLNTSEGQRQQQTSQTHTAAQTTAAGGPKVILSLLNQEPTSWG
jgi:hypothetical protein